jgi:hypothetical protein
MLNETPESEYDNGLRILARCIARAHMKKLALQQKMAVIQDKASVLTDNAQLDHVVIPPEAEPLEKQLEKQSDEMENRGATEDEPIETSR